MRKIPLTQGKVALIDDEDYEVVSLFKWQAMKCRNTYYAYTIIRTNKARTSLFMHRLILNAPDNKFTDHADNDGLNNRKYNLRFLTNQQNQMNRPKRHKNCTSKYKGVHWDKCHNKWIAKFHRQFIGYFNNETDAAIAYNEKAKLNPVAYLNKIA